MTTALLDLVTPVQGSLDGTWGNTVNNGITEYLDIAIAGTTTLPGDAPVTLANTVGDANNSFITSLSAQYMMVRVTGVLGMNKVITGPSHSKLYMIDHAGSGFPVEFKRVGQVPSVTIAVGEKCFVYYNGTDYVKSASSVVSGLTGILPVVNGGTGQSSYTDGQLLIGNSTGNTLTKASLIAGSGVTITPGPGSIAIAFTGPGSGSVTSVGLAAPSIFTVTGSPVTSAGTLTLSYSGLALPVLNGGTGVTAAGASGNVLKSTGTAWVSSPITSISGGIASQLLYQSAPGVTAFVPNGSLGQLLKSNGLSAPSWVNPTTSNAKLYFYAQF
jgi:hypothetical protein